MIRWLRGKWFDYKNRKFRSNEGWCMCGAAMDKHTVYDNHAPVDSWHYNRDRYIAGGK